MPISVSSAQGPIVPGASRMSCIDVVMSSSYPTGGEVLAPSAFGLNVIDFGFAKVGVAGTGSVTAARYDAANSKLLAYTAAAQVANATDLSAVTIRVLAFGH